MDGTRSDDGLDEHAVLSLLVEHSADLLARQAPNGTYLYVSPASRRLLGFEPDELVGRDPYEFLHPTTSRSSARCTSGEADPRSLELRPRGHPRRAAAVRCPVRRHAARGAGRLGWGL
jgi:PAS domain S-box-containing protein